MTYDPGRMLGIGTGVRQRASLSFAVLVLVGCATSAERGIVLDDPAKRESLIAGESVMLYRIRLAEKSGRFERT